jgi:predicted secreted protein
MTTGAKLGMRASVLIGADTIAEWTKASLKSGRDKVEVTNHDSGLVKEFLRAHLEWSIDLEANLKLSDTAGQKALVDAYLAEDDDDAIIDSFTITDAEGGNVISGSMFATNLGLDFPLKDGQKFTMTLQGTGALTIGA